jgi:hypothetical protein
VCWGLEQISRGQSTPSRNLTWIEGWAELEEGTIAFLDCDDPWQAAILRTSGDFGCLAFEEKDHD